MSDPPDGATILAARHLDATEGPVRVGSTVDTATRAAITRVLGYVAKAHNSPSVPAEQQLGRPENALERLRLAREALIRDGYFTADEVGPDVAPRIVEWLSHHRQQLEQARADTRTLGAGVQEWHDVAVRHQHWGQRRWIAWKSARARAQRAQAEVARLRAGEESGWDPLVVPTPGQWIARWNSLGPAQRLDRAKAVIEMAETANRCQFDGHRQRLEEDRQAWVTVARVTELRDSWLLMTLEPGQVRRLLDAITRALDGPAAVAGQPLTATQAAAVRAADLPRGSRIAREVVDEAVRQMGADPHGLHTGMVVKPYTERGVQKWVFRCWGTDTCDGWLSLDHASENSAGAARDRHLVEAHPELVATTLRERRERVGLLGAVLGEALAAFRSVVDDGTGTLVGYVSAPIHPTDMDRWRAVLDQSKER